jgi:hypothetical protein
MQIFAFSVTLYDPFKSSETLLPVVQWECPQSFPFRHEQRFFHDLKLEIKEFRGDPLSTQEVNMRLLSNLLLNSPVLLFRILMLKLPETSLPPLL